MGHYESLLASGAEMVGTDEAPTLSAAALKMQEAVRKSALGMGAVAPQATTVETSSKSGKKGAKARRITQDPVTHEPVVPMFIPPKAPVLNISFTTPFGKVRMKAEEFVSHHLGWLLVFTSQSDIVLEPTGGQVFDLEVGGDTLEVMSSGMLFEHKDGRRTMLLLQPMQDEEEQEISHE